MPGPRHQPVVAPPVSLTEIVGGEPTTVAQVAERQKATRRMEHMKQYFAKQPKETIRIRKDEGEQFVQINGYTFIIQAGVTVSVPRPVAEALRNAEII